MKKKSKIISFVVLAIIVVLSYFIASNFLFALVAGVINPAAVYCEKQGYNLTNIQTIVAQESYSYCVFPDRTMCEEWAFFRGECGEQYTSCVKQGFKIVSRTGNWSSFSTKYAVCAFPNGKECLAYDFVLGTCDQTRICPITPPPPPDCPNGTVLSGVGVINPKTGCPDSGKCIPILNETYCPTVCVPIWRYEDNSCVYTECGSGCGPDKVLNFATKAECLGSIICPLLAPPYCPNGSILVSSGIDPDTGCNRGAICVSNITVCCKSAPVIPNAISTYHYTTACSSNVIGVNNEVVADSYCNQTPSFWSGIAGSITGFFSWFAGLFHL